MATAPVLALGDDLDTYQLDMLRTVVQVVAFAVGGAVGLLWAIRTGWFTLNRSTMDALKENISALEQRVECLETKLTEYERLTEELEGEVAGKNRAIAEMVAAIGESRMCAKAWTCEERVIPTHRREDDRQ